MKRQFLSIILSVTLLASAIAGAISVSIKTAEADTIEATDTAYFMDFLDDVISVQPSMESEITEFFNLMNPYVGDTEENETRLTLMVNEGSTYIIQVMNVDSSNFYYYKRFTDKYGIAKDNSSSNSAPLGYTNIGSLYVDESNCVISYTNKSGSLWGIPSLGNYTLYNYYNTYNLAPTPGLFNREGLKFYCNKPILSGSWSISSSSANLLAGVSIRYCHLRQFTLGTRKLICLQEQNLAYAFKDDLWSTSHVEAYVIDQDSNIVQYDFRWSEMLVIDNIALYVNDVTGLGDETTGYAWIINEDWYSIGSFDIVYWAVDIWRHIWVTENVPFVLNQQTTDQLADQQVSEAWNNYNTYVNNYNTTHVVPEQLGEWLFNAEGSKMLPCTIQVPSSIAGSSTSYIDVFSYYTGSMETSGYNFDIMDVVIIDAGAATGYQLRYWYDDSLNPPYATVDQLVLANIISSFDIVIISNDNQGWFEEALAGSLAYTGSSSQGITRSSTPLIDNSATAFMLITQRGIQKQQLFNFNDGITKLYELEVNYIESEDLWKDSFLLWSASMFNMVNSLDGRLTSINTNILSINSLLESIKTAIDNIAAGDNPDNLQPWYLSLWNWISNFRPSDSDFSATLNQYDNNWEDFPELPAPSTVPLLPGGE